MWLSGPPAEPGQRLLAGQDSHEQEMTASDARGKRLRASTSKKARVIPVTLIGET